MEPNMEIPDNIGELVAQEIMQNVKNHIDYDCSLNETIRRVTRNKMEEFAKEKRAKLGIDKETTQCAKKDEEMKKFVKEQYAALGVDLDEELPEYPVKTYGDIFEKFSAEAQVYAKHQAKQAIVKRLKYTEELSARIERGFETFKADLETEIKYRRFKSWDKEVQVLVGVNYYSDEKEELFNKIGRYIAEFWMYGKGSNGRSYAAKDIDQDDCPGKRRAIIILIQAVLPDI
jgi:hypothetical protein